MEEEEIPLQDEAMHLREQVARRDAKIQELEMLIEQQHLLIQQMQEQVSGLSRQVKLLQDRLAKNSHNSSLPPSSDRFTRQPKSLREKSGKKTGGQVGHEGSSLQWSQTPDEIIKRPVTHCAKCQHDLQDVPVERIESRQVHDIPAPRVIVQEYRGEQKRCPACNHMTMASFPKGVQAPLQYGPTIGATAVYLTEQQLLPLARTAEVMQDVLGVALSEGTVHTLVRRTADALMDVEHQIKQALVKAEVIHQDETGLYVAGKRIWEHVTSTPTLTHYHVDLSRGQVALEAIGILPIFTGISIHDGWGSYFLYENCKHAACLVHILRELVFLSEEHGEIWAYRLKRLLLEIKKAADQARSQGLNELDPQEIAHWEAQYFQLLEKGEELHPRAVSPPGKQGRCKQSVGRNLIDRLRKRHEAMLSFMKDLRVDFDNNLAERDLRMIKVQQKISGCFRSIEGARNFSRIRGYLSTLRKQDIPVLSALKDTLCGHPVLPSFH